MSRPNLQGVVVSGTHPFLPPSCPPRTRAPIEAEVAFSRWNEETTAVKSVPRCAPYSEALVPSERSKVRARSGTRDSAREKLHRKCASSSDPRGARDRGGRGAAEDLRREAPVLFILPPPTVPSQDSGWCVMRPHSATQQIFTKQQRICFSRFGVLSLLITAEFFLCFVICALSWTLSFTAFYKPPSLPSPARPSTVQAGGSQ